MQKKKVHCLSESKAVRRNCLEEDDSNTHFVVDRVEEGQVTTTTNDTQCTTNLKLQDLTVPLKLDMSRDVNILPM